MTLPFEQESTEETERIGDIDFNQEVLKIHEGELKPR